MDKYLYTELDNITEKEFFNRELGLKKGQPNHLMR